MPLCVTDETLVYTLFGVCWIYWKRALKRLEATVGFPGRPLFTDIPYVQFSRPIFPPLLDALYDKRWVPKALQ